MKMLDHVDITYLRETFEYNPDTGEIFRRAKRVGTFDGKDRLVIGIKQRPHQFHRVAWAIHYGEWPQLYIDHIDGNPMNNKLDNLRLATPSENQRNRKRQSNNKSGVKGIIFNKQKNKWQAKICIHGKQINLGFFSTKEDAAQAYKSASGLIHGDFGRAE